MSQQTPSEDQVRRVVEAYRIGDVAAVRVFDVGHINSSFRVDVATGQGPSDPAGRTVFVQRINSYVFPRPDHVMTNVSAVVDHLRDSELGALELVRGPDGEPSHQDADGETWRIFGYVDHAPLGRTPETLAHVEAASFAFGAFHRGVGDLDPTQLETTIEHFHDTPHRFLALDRAVAENQAERKTLCASEIDRSMGARSMAATITDRLGSSEVPLRCVHNDAKFSNVLLAQVTHQPLCVVDLDTVMPGSVLYDLGHMIRSMSHTFDEDEPDLSRIRIDGDRFGAILRGYFNAAPELLTPTERSLIVAGAEVMVLQEAIRFLTDHLDGDLYFPARRENQNLDRCRMHLALLDALEDQRDELTALVPQAVRSH